jgi:two-component system chemotaxis response regulator CheY
MDKQINTRILIVDDSSFIRSLIVDTLQGTEFEIVGQADNGADAIKLYNSLRPDLLLLDLIMPSGTGLEVLERLIKDYPGAQAIMISSLGTEDMVVECLQRGARHFIRKPFDRETLLRELRRHTRNDERIQRQTVTSPVIGTSLKNFMVGKRFFGEYLLEKHRITREQLLLAIGYQKSVNMTIEQICIQEALLDGLNFIDEDDMAHIKNVLKVNLDKDIAQILLEESLIPQDRLERARKHHHGNQVRIGEALIKVNALTSAELEEELRIFREEEAREEGLISRDLESAGNKDIIKHFIGYTAQIVEKILQEAVKVKACIPSAVNFVPNDYTIEQKAKGAREVAFILNIPDAFLLCVATAMYGRPINTINAQTEDAVKEFLNIIDGNSLSHLSFLGTRLVSYPPEIFRNFRGTSYPFQPNDNFLIVSLKSTMGDFDIILKGSI